MAANELFTVSIPTIKSHAGGSIACTSPAPQVYVLTWSSPPDNRLTPAFNTALMTALDIIEFGHPPGVVITTSAISKFYSNGLDLQLALSTPGFTENSLYPLFRRFLTYPMPTIALVNGHAFAGGFMLAMHHDYRVFTGAKGYMCINELEFGVPLMPPMSSIFRIKTAPHVYRTMVLEAHRFDAKAALEAGLVDAIGDMDAALGLIQERALVKKGASTAYGMLKAEMYRESVALLDAEGKDVANPAQWQAAEKQRKTEGAKRFTDWSKAQSDKPKL
ncbi:enoyl-CoA hydratase/isomerase family protein [Hypoxylon fuscum]|nr:enoyl-CoA hydratase/isomerase family protein [Hypoxylon fuscum]